MYKFKKAISLALASILALGAVNVSAFAADDEIEELIPSMEEILSEYHMRINQLKYNSDIATYSSTSAEDEIAAIHEETVEALNEAGYEAYYVNPSNYAETEVALHTDFSTAGMSPEYSYIVALGDENTVNAQSNGTPSSEFNYTYNGKTYRMRTFTVAGDDDPNFVVQTRNEELFSSKVKSVIENCLKAAIITKAGNLSKSLGTILTILDIAISSIDTTYVGHETRAEANCYTTWHRKYTDVYDPNTGEFLHGSAVERAGAYTKVELSHYNKDEGMYIDTTAKSTIQWYYSDNYNNVAWQMNTAVQNYGDSIKYDIVESVTHSYNGKNIVTHTVHG